MTEIEVSATLNVQRFRKQAETALKLGNVNAAQLSQICGSMEHLKSTRVCDDTYTMSNGDDFSELRKLVSNVKVCDYSQQSKQSQEAEKDVLRKRTNAIKSQTLLPKNKRKEGDKESVQQQQHDTTSGQKITALLQQSQLISTQELEHEQAKHTELISEVSELVGSLKDAALLMHKLVGEQNIQLDEMGVVAEENMTELSAQKEKMKEQTKAMTSSVWTTVGTIIWLLALFTITYAVMRIFPKPS